MKYKISFKKHSIPTGPMAIGYGTPSTSFFINGVEVGEIRINDHARANIDKITIHFMGKKRVDDGNNNCPWQWRKFNFKPKDIKEAKNYVREVKDYIIKSLTEEQIKEIDGIKELNQ